jgi:hypothetical protein
MLRWFPTLQVATACFSCSPPDLNFLGPYFIFMYMHYNHCQRATDHLQFNILLFCLCLCIYEVDESIVTLKEKPSLSRSRQLAEAPRISRQSGHEGGRYVTPTNRPPLAPRMNPSYLLEAAICDSHTCVW